MKVFVPFSEALIEELGLSIGELVPFQLEYQCLRMNELGRLFERSPHEPIPSKESAAGPRA